MGAAHEYFYSHDVPKVGRTRNLLAMSFAEVAERIKEPGQDVILVPLGSTEMADCLHTPLVPFGYSPDEILPYLRYKTGAFFAFYKTPTEREVNILHGIFENPPEETHGWHSSEMETYSL